MCSPAAAEPYSTTLLRSAPYAARSCATSSSGVIFAMRRSVDHQSRPAPPPPNPPPPPKPPKPPKPPPPPPPPPQLPPPPPHPPRIPPPPQPPPIGKGRKRQPGPQPRRRRPALSTDITTTKITNSRKGLIPPLPPTGPRERRGLKAGAGARNDVSSWKLKAPAKRSATRSVMSSIAPP